MRISSISEWLLRQSLIWGGLGCLGFYAFVVEGSETTSTIHRYFAAHWINYAITTLFFVGLAALVIKLLGILIESATLDAVRLPSAGIQGQTVGDVPALLAELESLTPSLQRSRLGERLRNALAYVQRKGTADTLESHLNALEGIATQYAKRSFAFVQTLLATIPILGFLGTVAGITLAVGELDFSTGELEKSWPAAIAGLSVAFDTTAQALVLATLLLFAKFSVEKAEFRLLQAVDENSAEQLIGRFEQYGSEKDSHLASIRRMSEQMLAVVQATTEKQGELFTTSLETTGRRCTELLDHSAAALVQVLSGASASLEESFAAAATTLDEALSGAVVEGLTRHAKALNQGVDSHTKRLEDTLLRHAELLNDGLENHAATLATAEAKMAEENRRHLAEVEAAVGEAMLVATGRQEKLISKSELVLREMQTSLVDSASAAIAQQEQLVRLGDVLLRVVEGTSQIRQLEDALQGNLQVLATTNDFQKTISSLSAIMQLLGAHLGKTLVTGEGFDLSNNRQQTKAA